MSPIDRWHLLENSKNFKDFLILNLDTIYRDAAVRKKMDFINKIKKITLFSAFSTLVLLWAGVYLFFFFHFTEHQNSEFKELTNNIHKLFDTKLKEKHENLNFLLSQILKSEKLSEALFEKNHQKMHTVMEHYYKELQNSNSDINILTFRDSENIVVYRAHKPEFYGDSLNEKRKIIIDTNRLRDSFCGFEVGKLKITYRVTKPVFYNNEFVGTLEIGLDPKNILSGMDSIFKTDIGIAAENKYLDVMLKKSVVFIGERHFLISSSTKLENSFSKSDKNNDMYKIDTGIFLKNHLDEKIGFLVIGFDTSKAKKKNQDLINEIFIVVMFISTVITLILLKGFNRAYIYFKDKIYTGYLAELANKEALNEELISDKNKILIISKIKSKCLNQELKKVRIDKRECTEIAKIFNIFAKKHNFNLYKVSNDEYILIKYEEDFEEERYIELVEKIHKEIKMLRFVESFEKRYEDIDIYSGISFHNIFSLEYAQAALKKADRKSTR